MEKCPVCEYRSNIKTWDHNERFNVDCPRCGAFCFTRTAKRKLESLEAIENDWRWKLSYWLRKGYREGDRLEVNYNVLMEIIDEIKLPKPKEQSNNLMRWLSQNLKHHADTITTDPLILSAIVGCKDEVGVHYIASHLQNQKYITYEFKNTSGNNPQASVTLGLTFEGWDKIEELDPVICSGNIAFMAMQYDDKKHTEIYKTHFKEAVAKTGFELRRLDENLKAGLIDNQLRIEIRNARLLLADLTNDNNGAYWEAGYAEGLGKSVIYLCERSHFDRFKTHFDTNHHTTIIWDENNLVEALENLKATIRATFPADAKMTDD